MISLNWVKDYVDLEDQDLKEVYYTYFPRRDKDE